MKFIDYFQWFSIVLCWVAVGMNLSAWKRWGNKIKMSQVAIDAANQAEKLYENLSKRCTCQHNMYPKY